jgi:hypothetical protein|nr:MAG TPA: putative periplasmic lipoprotein [Caudoviricetes sp.]
MKEKIKRICKKMYDGYQKLVAKVGADRLVHLFLSVGATVVGAMILRRAFAMFPVWVAAMISALAVFAFGLRKERADADYGGGFDKVDLMWGGIGCAVGFMVCVILM